MRHSSLAGAPARSWSDHRSRLGRRRSPGKDQPELPMQAGEGPIRSLPTYPVWTYISQLHAIHDVRSRRRSVLMSHQLQSDSVTPSRLPNGCECWATTQAQDSRSGVPAGDRLVPRQVHWIQRPALHGEATRGGGPRGLSRNRPQNSSWCRLGATAFISIDSPAPGSGPRRRERRHQGGVRRPCRAARVHPAGGKQPWPERAPTGA
jgi:hypothetical protein